MPVPKALSAEEVLLRLRENIRWVEEKAREEEKRWIEIAFDLKTIRDQKWWRCPKGVVKPFRTFDQFVEHECRSSRSKVYQMISVAETLAPLVSQENLMRIGKSNSYELVKVAKAKPKLVDQIAKKIIAGGPNGKPIAFSAVKVMVNRAVSGHHFDNGKWEHIDFLVAEEDAEEVHMALKVAGAMENKGQESAAERGKLLVVMAQEFLSGNEQARVRKQIAQAESELAMGKGA